MTTGPRTTEFGRHDGRNIATTAQPNSTATASTPESSGSPVSMIPGCVPPMKTAKTRTVMREAETRALAGGVATDAERVWTRSGVTGGMVSVPAKTRHSPIGGVRRSGRRRRER